MLIGALEAIEVIRRLDLLFTLRTDIHGVRRPAKNAGEPGRSKCSVDAGTGVPPVGRVTNIPLRETRNLAGDAPISKRQSRQPTDV